MKGILGGKLGTILIILATVVLAGVAIFTAIRLYQLRQTSISPVAPSSRPHAQELPSGSPGATTEATTEATTAATSQATATATSTAEATAVAAATATATASATLAPDTGTGTGASTSGSLPAPDTITYNACSLTLTRGGTVVTPTPTPTIPPTEGPTESPTVQPSGAPNSCGGTCGSNINCNNDLFCNTTVGLCRNPSCPSEADCVCNGTPGPTSPPSTTRPASTRVPSTPAPELPQSGTDWPTYAGAAFGILIIIGSLLLAL